MTNKKQILKDNNIEGIKNPRSISLKDLKYLIKKHPENIIEIKIDGKDYYIKD